MSKALSPDQDCSTLISLGFASAVLTRIRVLASGWASFESGCWNPLVVDEEY